MAAINIVSVTFPNNPAPFSTDVKLEITFEAFEALPQDLEWQLIFVSAEETGTTRDQKLDSVFIGPTPQGRHFFVLETPGPNPHQISKADLIGVSCLLLKVLYNNQEFIHLGWYVEVEYSSEELNQNPPQAPAYDKLVRKITSDVRITNFPIKWREEADAEVPQMPVVEEVVNEEIAFDLAFPEEDDMAEETPEEGAQEQGEEREEAKMEKEQDKTADEEDLGDEDSDTDEEEQEEDDIEGDESEEQENANDEDEPMEEDTEMKSVDEVPDKKESAPSDSNALLDVTNA